MFVPSPAPAASPRNNIPIFQWGVLFSPAAGWKKKHEKYLWSTMTGKASIKDVCRS
jgi:hypothetical protein